MAMHVRKMYFISVRILIRKHYAYYTDLSARFPRVSQSHLKCNALYHLCTEIERRSSLGTLFNLTVYNLELNWRGFDGGVKGIRCHASVVCMLNGCRTIAVVKKTSDRSNALCVSFNLSKEKLPLMQPITLMDDKFSSAWRKCYVLCDCWVKLYADLSTVFNSVYIRGFFRSSEDTRR